MSNVFSASWEWLKDNFAAIAVIAILGAAFYLIGLPLLNARSTILQRLADQNYARGVITYVITVGTIAIAVALVLGVLIGGNNASATFDKGKEVLVLLVGVLGTILGFYYGAATEAHTRLTIATDSIDFAATDTLRITAYITGGQGPYTYRFVFEPDTLGSFGPFVTDDGWIRAAIAVQESIRPRSFTLTALDATGRSESVQRRGPPDE